MNYTTGELINLHSECVCEKPMGSIPVKNAPPALPTQMTQYCRYCTACCVANGNWCEIKQKPLTDAQIKHSNKCRDFEFCSMDVYDENRTYQPRKKKPRSRFDSFQEDLFSMLMGNK